MHRFERRGKELYCEGAKLEDLAESYGTPLYVYSHATICRHFQVFDQAFADAPHIVCFAAKANSNLAILSLLRSLGAGADIVSGGELFLAQKSGMTPDRIVYSGVGKTASEIEMALAADILMFNIESIEELEALDRVAGRMGKKARVALRVNPDVDPKTHPYVATGLKTSKFGIDTESAIQGYERAGLLRNIEAVGVDCHIGSQLTEIGPFREAVFKLRGLVVELRKRGFDIRYLDLGGGLGITYDDEDPPSPAEYARAVLDGVRNLGVTLILEPGRNIVGNAAVLLARVLYVKENEGKRFVIVDAGMNDLIRPSLYDSFHAVEEVVQSDRSGKKADVVGPICESGDFLARDRDLPGLIAGDLIAVMSAGAYGFSMASTYNSRPLSAEVLVRGCDAFLIRERGTYEDLVRGAHVPNFL